MLWRILYLRNVASRVRDGYVLIAFVLNNRNMLEFSDCLVKGSNHGSLVLFSCSFLALRIFGDFFKSKLSFILDQKRKINLFYMGHCDESTIISFQVHLDILKGVFGRVACLIKYWSQSILAKLGDFTMLEGLQMLVVLLEVSWSVNHRELVDEKFAFLG